MAINKAMLMALKAISYNGAKDVYRLKRGAETIMSAPVTLNQSTQRLNRKIVADGREVPIRVYPGTGDELIIFIHGGGWVTESIDTYNNVCSCLAEKIGSTVVSIGYSLAPENRFPEGLKDCYTAVKEIFQKPEYFGVKPENIVLIGDSAGGNLTAAVSLMARDTGDFKIARQVLIYPATNNDHSENSQFESVRTNGKDYLLTAKAVNDYMELYKNTDEDYKNPYFAPLLMEDLSQQPKTLVITAEFDPLRDEGEAYGIKLRDGGNDVKIYRMKDSLHGFFSMSYRFAHVRKAYNLIEEFLCRE